MKLFNLFKRKNEKDVSDIVFVVLLSFGVSIMLYPIISNSIYTNKYNHIVTNYKEQYILKQQRKKELLDKAILYNKRLTDIYVLDIFGNEAEKNSSEYNSILRVVDDGMMGYIEIPKIDIKLPIYHGTSDEVLKSGVGHFSGSSFPVGGKSTHSVLTAHRGLPSSKLFTDLNQMGLGDVFYIYILDDVLAYQVDKISVVEPDDIKELKLVDGMDYVTLITCTPYAINTHRLLVRGRRIDYDVTYSKSVAKSHSFTISNILFYIGFNIVLTLLMLKIILKYCLYTKKEIVYFEDK